jgi:F-box protein 21
MDDSPFHMLPDELLESVVFYLEPVATLAFGASCKRGNKIAYEELLWRKHCIETWKYWQPSHNLSEKLEQPLAQVKWRQLYSARHKTDSEARGLFEELLKTQQYRIQRIEEITERGYDVKDLFLQLRDQTPDDAEDVLARRYFADAVLGQIHRRTALEKWTRLQKGQMVRLEEVLGAYDLFVLGGRKGDLGDIDRELDRIAEAVKAGDEEFEGRSIRQKAIQVAEYLRTHRLVGNPTVDDYHNLRNNFISIALFDEPHTSLPLQSVAIYCAVARKLGINARPSNYPGHVHAVIEAPSNVSLNGAERTPPGPGEDHDPEIMHMDPWHSSNEISRDDLTHRLSQMGAPAGQHGLHVAATTSFEMAIRTGRNIMHSVQEAQVCQLIVIHR